MFNLIVKSGGGANSRDTFLASRVFEHTDQALLQRYSREGGVDFEALLALPTVFMGETTGQPDQVARVGSLSRVRSVGRELSLEYNYDAELSAIPNSILKEYAVDLEIEDFEFHRTHWAVKDVDLFRILLRRATHARQRPTVFQLPEHEIIEPALASAMMPFHPNFNAVYEALRNVSESVGLRCRRADDIWENPLVIQDVVSLIDKSRVVICDCTGRNPNVFYEIGIAHTLGRDVILITQNEADIPFDLRHLRYVRYLNNGEGLAALSARLQPRLADLMAE